MRSRVATLEGPGGALGASKNGPRVFLFRSLEAKYTYLRGFEHADFVNLMWPLEAPGRSWEDFGPPRSSKVDFGRLRGGLEAKGSGPGGLQEVPRREKTRFWSCGRFPRNAPDLINIVVSAFF